MFYSSVRSSSFSWCFQKDNFIVCGAQCRNPLPHPGRDGTTKLMRRSGRNRRDDLSVGLLRLFLLCAFCLVAAAPHRRREAATSKTDKAPKSAGDGKSKVSEIKKTVSEPSKNNAGGVEEIVNADKTAQNNTETKSNSKTEDKSHPSVIVDETNLKEITVSKSDKKTANSDDAKQPAADDSSSQSKIKSDVSNDGQPNSKTGIDDTKIDAAKTQKDASKPEKVPEQIPASDKEVLKPSKSSDDSHNVSSSDHIPPATEPDQKAVAQKAEVKEKAVVSVKTSGGHGSGDGGGDGGGGDGDGGGDVDGGAGAGDGQDAKEVNFDKPKNSDNTSEKTESDQKKSSEKTESKAEETKNPNDVSKDSEKSKHDEQNSEGGKSGEKTTSKDQVAAADKNTTKDSQDEKSEKVVVVSEEDLKKNPAFDVNKLFPTKPPPASSDKKVLFICL